MALRERAAGPSLTTAARPEERAARQIWRRAAGHPSPPAEVARSVDRVCNSLRLGLGRWIGTEGHRALLDRAIAEVRAGHPALAGLACLGRDGPAARAAIEAHGAGAVEAGMVALLAAMIAALARIMGDTMAVRLMEQAGAPGRPGRGRESPAGGDDG